MYVEAKTQRRIRTKCTGPILQLCMIIRRWVCHFPLSVLSPHLPFNSNFASSDSGEGFHTNPGFPPLWILFKEQFSRQCMMQILRFVWTWGKGSKSKTDFGTTANYFFKIHLLVQSFQLLANVITVSLSFSDICIYILLNYRLSMKSPSPFQLMFPFLNTLLQWNQTHLGWETESGCAFRSTASVTHRDWFSLWIHIYNT